MVYTVTFNPAIDYVVHSDKMKVGDVNRSKGEEIYIGGKGINVSIVLSELGIKSKALGFIAGFTGDAVENGVKEKGIDAEFVRLPEGFTRINVKIKSDEETELNGQGPRITDEALDELFEKLDKISGTAIAEMIGYEFIAPVGCAQELPGHFHFFGGHVFQDGYAGGLFEQPHHVLRVKGQITGHIRDGQVFTQVFFQIRDQFVRDQIAGRTGFVFQGGGCSLAETVIPDRPDRLVDDSGQVVIIHRFDQIVAAPELDCLAHVIVFRVAGQDDIFSLYRVQVFLLPHPFNQLKPAFSGHFNVADHDIDMGPGNELPCLRSVRCGRRIAA